MSNLQRKLLSYHGIECYLSKKYNITDKQIINKIMKEFLLSNKLLFIKHNKRYKGLFTAEICNAETIQEHFQEFTIFVSTNIIKYEKNI